MGVSKNDDYSEVDVCPNDFEPNWKFKLGVLKADFLVEIYKSF